MVLRFAKAWHQLGAGRETLSGEQPMDQRDVLDYPRCANCGYNVRGLPSPICPECGANLNAVGCISLRDSRKDRRKRILRAFFFTVLMAILAPGVLFLLYHTILPVAARRHTGVKLANPRSQAYTEIWIAALSTTWHNPLKIPGRIPWQHVIAGLVDLDVSYHSIAVNLAEGTFREVDSQASDGPWRPLTNDALSQWIQDHARVDDARLPKVAVEVGIVRRLLDDVARRDHLFEWSNVFFRDGLGWIVALPDNLGSIRDRRLSELAAPGFNESYVGRAGNVTVVEPAKWALFAFWLLLWVLGVRAILVKRKRGKDRPGSTGSRVAG
jgi:hypothetical protein